MKQRHTRILLILVILAPLLVAGIYEGLKQYRALMKYRLNTELGLLAATVEAQHFFADDYSGVAARDIQTAMERSRYGMITYDETTDGYRLDGMPLRVRADPQADRPAFAIQLAGVEQQRCTELAGYQVIQLEGQGAAKEEVMDAFERDKNEFSVWINNSPEGRCRAHDNQVLFRFERP